MLSRARWYVRKRNRVRFRHPKLLPVVRHSNNTPGCPHGRWVVVDTNLLTFWTTMTATTMVRQVVIVLPVTMMVSIFHASNTNVGPGTVKRFHVNPCMALMTSLLWRPVSVHEKSLFLIWIVIQLRTISQFFSDNNRSVYEIECCSNESATNKSFRVKLLYDAYNVMKPKSWPSRVGVRPYYRKRVINGGTTSKSDWSWSVIHDNSLYWL